MYESGHRAKQDYAEAAHLCRKAADEGDANAQFNHGFMYKNGEGVKQGYAEAVRLCRKAADQGHEGA
jgi:TPR repeat protein